MTDESVRFEVGKFYRHSTGREIHVVGQVEGVVYWHSPALVCEGLGDGAPSFVGGDADSAANWSECEPWIERDGGVFSAASGVRACTKGDLCCAGRPKDVHYLGHCICERCGWNGRPDALVDDCCPECGAGRGDDA